MAQLKARFVPFQGLEELDERVGQARLLAAILQCLVNTGQASAEDLRIVREGSAVVASSPTRTPEQQRRSRPGRRSYVPGSDPCVRHFRSEGA